MRVPSRLAALCLLLAGVVRASAPPPSAAGEDPAPLYVDPVAFGPQNVSFPWFATFSPDGKWVAFSDGHSAYVEIWDAAKNVRVWPTDGKSRTGTHRVVFSGDGSEVAFGDGEHVVVLALEEGAWKDAHEITLLSKAPIQMANSPLRMTFESPGPAVLFSTGTGAATVDLSCGCIEAVGPWKDVHAAFGLRDGNAVSLRDAFVTRIVPHRGEPVDVPGLLLETDAKGTTWLVAADRARADLGPLSEKPDARLALEVRDARATKARASFEIAAKADPAKPAFHRVLVQAQFSPDGAWLATVEGSGLIVLRDAATGAPRQTIREYENPPYAMGVAFSPDGARLVTGGRRKDGPECLIWKRRAP
jgi:hypothetical protein